MSYSRNSLCLSSRSAVNMYDSSNLPVKEKCSLFLTFADNHVLTVGLYVTHTHTHTHTHVYNTCTVEMVEAKCKH